MLTRSSETHEAAVKLLTLALNVPDIKEMTEEALNICHKLAVSRPKISFPSVATLFTPASAVSIVTDESRARVSAGDGLSASAASAGAGKDVVEVTEALAGKKVSNS
jgi:hypothetical protein